MEKVDRHPRCVHRLKPEAGDHPKHQVRIFRKHIHPSRPSERRMTATSSSSCLETDETENLAIWSNLVTDPGQQDVDDHPLENRQLGAMISVN